MSWTGDITNISIGSFKAWWNDGTGEVPIGYCEGSGDKTVTYSPEYKEIMAAETAGALHDKILTKEAAKIVFNCLEDTLLTMKLQLPLATAFTGGAGGGTSYGLGGNTYASLLAVAGTLRIHPINNLAAGGGDDETYLANDYVFWKCANSAAAEFAYKAEDVNVFKVELDAFLDTSKAAGMQLFLKGDPANTTLDVTAPTVSTMKAEISDSFTTITSAGTPLANVDATTKIQINVSEALTPGSSVNKANFIIQENGSDVPVAFTVACPSPYTQITITPSSSLGTGKTYTVTVNGLFDSGGNEQTTAFSRQITIA